MLRLRQLQPLVTFSLRETLTSTISLSRQPHPHPPPFTQPHLLLQRFPVSGTPKGKARLKNLAHHKKSSFQKNKKPSSSIHPNARSPFDSKKPRSLPLRLNAKLRRREAIRQELGLHSKLHRRDLELRRAREEPASARPPITGLRGVDLVQLGYFDCVPSAFQMTVEDGRKLAREYSRIMMHWNRMRQTAEGEALQIMREAVEAMPEDLRRKALVPAVKRRKKKVLSSAGSGKGKVGAKVVSGRKPAVAAGKKGAGKGGKKA